jgi:hypothetical protein
VHRLWIFRKKLSAAVVVFIPLTLVPDAAGAAATTGNKAAAKGDRLFQRFPIESPIPTNGCASAMDCAGLYDLYDQ